MPDPSPDQIRTELKVVLRHAFTKTIRDRKALEFAVDLALKQRDGGQQPCVQWYDIADHLYPGAREDDTFKAMSNVRSTMMRVRHKLERYYRKGGAKDEIVIKINLRDYTPRFERRFVSSVSLEEDFFGKLDGNVQFPPNVRFWEFKPHRNLKHEPDAISLIPDKGCVKLGAPLTKRTSEIEAFMTKLIRIYHDKRRDEYWKLLVQNKHSFSEEDRPKGKKGRLGKRLKIIEQLRSNPKSGLKKARMHNLENFLLTWTGDPKTATTVHDWNERPRGPDKYRHIPLQWNGRNLMLLSLRELWEDSVTYECKFCESDYYTYRCAADCSSWIRTKLEPMLGEGEKGLQRYLADPQILHGGFGVLVVVCTSDSKLVIRKRSEACADYLDANKFAASANEGLRADKDVNRDGAIKPCTAIVARALKNELVGYGGRGLELVRKMKCKLTGVLLYLPNLVINLCFLVHLDAELEEIDKLARKAPHEHEFIHEATRGESFTRQDICSFISTTRQPDVAGQYLYANTWCEGSLVPFYFALLDIES